MYLRVGGIYSRVVCGCVYLGFVSVSGGLGPSFCLFRNVMLAECDLLVFLVCVFSVCEVDLRAFDKCRLFVTVYVFEFLELMMGMYSRG